MAPLTRQSKSSLIAASRWRPSCRSIAITKAKTSTTTTSVSSTTTTAARAAATTKPTNRPASRTTTRKCERCRCWHVFLVFFLKIISQQARGGARSGGRRRWHRCCASRAATENAVVVRPRRCADRCGEAGHVYQRGAKRSRLSRLTPRSRAARHCDLLDDRVWRASSKATSDVCRRTCSTHHCSISCIAARPVHL